MSIKALFAIFSRQCRQVRIILSTSRSLLAACGDLKETVRAFPTIKRWRLVKMARKAKQLYRQGYKKKAAKISIRALELCSDRWIFNYIAGRSLPSRKDPYKYLGAALVLRPNDHRTLEALIAAILRSKNLRQFAPEYLRYLHHATAISPKDLPTITRLIHVLAASEDLETVAAEYSRFYEKAGFKPEIIVAPIRTVHSWSATSQSPLLDAGEIEQIPLKSPVVFGHSTSSEVVYRQSNKPYVADIKNARIFSHSSVILTPDGNALSDVAGHENLGQYVSFDHEKRFVLRQKDRLLLDLTEFKNREVEAGIFLSGLASEYFGHWMAEFLPKLQFLQQHPDFKKLPLIIDADLPLPYLQHLRRFADNDLILLQADESLLCNRLLVAPSSTFFPVHLTRSLDPYAYPGPSARTLQFLRGDRGAKGKPHRRIFTARKDMKWRQMANEDEVAAALLKTGFEIVYMHNMTMDEQITLFQEAEWIVAPNGSALYNIIFADPSVKLLILGQRNLYNWATFQGPIEELGYHPVFVCGEFTGPASHPHSDYSISLETLQQALTSMGLHYPSDEAEIVN